jgi:putative DNA primase/helicase
MNENDIKVIAHLASLSPIEYDRCRKEEAEKLGIGVKVLDNEVNNVKKLTSPDDKKSLTFNDVELWSEAIDMELLLDEIVETTQRFIICERHTAIATALWCAFSWIIDDVQVAPLAVITAPEKRCGKSQLLNFMGRLVKRPLVASNISPASVFRVVEAYQPTLLIDEADTFFKQNEELRGIVNSGHTRQSAYVIRTVGDDHEPKQFSTWGSKVICGIGSVADTIQDRAIMLELRRKLPNESIERLRHAENGLFNRLRSQLARFAEDAGGYISTAKPQLPEQLNDRAQDNWEPLLAIADYAGGKWSELARETALIVSGSQQESMSLSTELLADIKEVFEIKYKDRVSSADLISFLIEDDLKPWATYNRGKPISPRQLAKRLSEYGIKSKDIRFGYDGVKKGYELSQFEDAFIRYINSDEEPPEKCATTQQNLDKQDSTTASDVADTNECCATDNQNATLKALKNNGCCGVADKSVDADDDSVEVRL